MTRTASDYQRMGIWRLRELARATHEEHDPEAARVFVARILDMEVERRTLYGDEHLQGIVGSAIAPGHAPGGTDIAREPLAALYDRGIFTREQHEEARRWIEAARLPPRQLLAVLIQTRKLDRRAQGTEWAANYDQIAARLAHFAHLLGFDGGVAAGHTLHCIEDTPRETSTCPPHDRVAAPRDARERRILAERYEQAQQGPRTRRIRTAHQVPTFKAGKAITDAAARAKASLILLAKL